MNLFCKWRTLLINLFIQICFMPEIHCNAGTVSHLSKEEMLVFKDEENPKCFTRTEEDFTCFFETMDNRTHDFYYKYENQLQKKCEMSVQRTEEGTFLHMCYFPNQDVTLYSELNVTVLEPSNNTMLFSRIVSVEDHNLLDPPFNVSLNPKDNVGLLWVSWHTKSLDYFEEKQYKIRYSSGSLHDKIEKTKKNGHELILTPGQEVKVQVAVRCCNSEGGHWSVWSQPVQASVPQSTDDISLMCHTSNLYNVTCHWNGHQYGAENKFKLYYKIRESEWIECLDTGNTSDMCYFHDDELRKFKVKLNNTRTERIFFSKELMLKDLIKTSAPGNLRGMLRQDKLCLEWDSPLPSLSTHLQYEVGIQITGGERWSIIKGPETDTCVQIPLGSQFSIKIRAKPTGNVYSGNWSDWSDVLSGETPPDIGMLTTCGIVVPMAMIVIVLIYIFRLKRRRIKQYFWPPLPNLEKVLQGFLTDIDRQKWDPPFTAKQCFEETTSSVLEIMSESEVPGSGKTSEQSFELLPSDGSVSSEEHVDGNSGTEVFPDYVTLNKEIVMLCLEENSYVCELVREKDPEVRDELLQTCNCSFTDAASYVKPCSDNNFTNHCYLLMSESKDNYETNVGQIADNLYTNLPHS